jgi:hypothetical protein
VPSRGHFVQYLTPGFPFFSRIAPEVVCDQLRCVLFDLANSSPLIIGESWSPVQPFSCFLREARLSVARWGLRFVRRVCIMRRSCSLAGRFVRRFPQISTGSSNEIQHQYLCLRSSRAVPSVPTGLRSASHVGIEHQLKAQCADDCN